MQAGDGVFVLVQVHFDGLAWTEIANTVTGGQDWHELTSNVFQISGQPLSCRAYLARFNGTWAANPTWDGAVAVCTSASMSVFRSDDANFQFDIDGLAGMFSFTSFVAGATITRTGITTETNGAVVIAGIASVDDNDLAVTTATWATALPSADLKNVSSTGQAMAIAYKVFPTAGASGNIQWSMGGTAGTDLGLSFILALKLVSKVAYVSPTQPTVDFILNMEAGTSGNVITTANLTAATNDNGAGGVWSTSGGTPANTYVATAAEMPLTSNFSVKVGSTGYNDSGATRGARYDHTAGTATPSWNYAFAANKAIVSMGFFFKTTHAYHQLNSFTSMALFADGSGAFAAWNLVTQFLTEHVARLECNSTTVSAPHFVQSQDYWISLLIDTTASLGRLSMWKKSGTSWIQYGFTVSAPLGFSGSTVNRLQVFCSGGAYEAHTGDSYYDDVVLDWTTHAFPLLPGLGVFASQTPRPSGFRYRYAVNTVN